MRLSKEHARKLGIEPGKPKPRQKAERVSDGFLALLKAHGLPTPEPEYRFHPVRRWRFDWAFVGAKVALEIDGGVWLKGGGRHNRGKGFVNDMAKLNAAACLGWRVLRCVPADLKSGAVIPLLKEAILGKP